MRIISDNPELLKELETRFKRERVKATPIKVPTDVSDKGILEDIVQLVIENPNESRAVVQYVLSELISFANQEHISIIKRDGTPITYVEYQAMSDEEKSKEIFSV